MRKTVALSLILLIFLQLVGGINIASAFNITRTSALPVNTAGQHYSKTLLVKAFSFSQFQEVEDTEEGVAKNTPYYYSQPISVYKYRPVFSPRNKHFLIHFGSAIKDKLPRRSILYCSFLI